MTHGHRLIGSVLQPPNLALQVIEVLSQVSNALNMEQVSLHMSRTMRLGASYWHSGTHCSLAPQDVISRHVMEILPSTGGI